VEPVFISLPPSLDISCGLHHSTIVLELFATQGREGDNFEKGLLYSYILGRIVRSLRFLELITNSLASCPPKEDGPR
jgi:hypothetical protein